MLAISLAIKLNQPRSGFLQTETLRTRRPRDFGLEIPQHESPGERRPRRSSSKRTTRGSLQIGGFLRKSSLDELPQLFNVLGGSMSLVGPRPHASAHNEYYRQQIDGYMLRHEVKPGITGLAQVNGCRGETEQIEKMERRVYFDHKYIREWCDLARPANPLEDLYRRALKAERVLKKWKVGSGNAECFSVSPQIVERLSPIVQQPEQTIHLNRRAVEDNCSTIGSPTLSCTRTTKKPGSWSRLRFLRSQPAPQRCACTGNRKVKQVPLPTVLSTRITPWCA
jgi:hypothetical protein